MLRITVHDDPESLTFQLEGKLSGPWVCEAEGCWQRAMAAQQRWGRNAPKPPGKPVRFDLTGVTSIDASGKALLAAAHAQGVRLVASGCLMRALVADIANEPIRGCGCPEYEGEP